MRIAEAEQQASQPRRTPAGASSRGGDEVVDAEFEEVDDKRRRAS